MENFNKEKYSPMIHGQEGKEGESGGFNMHNNAIKEHLNFFPKRTLVIT